MPYLNPNFLYPELSMYHLDSGASQFFNQGRFMINGASDGVDMVDERRRCRLW